MGRHKKATALQEKIDKYLEEYELDELNQANDMSALTQMCQIELNMEHIQQALESMDYVKGKGKEIDSKQIRELHSALRDANQNWITLQTELGINRKKRQRESDESPLKYIERVQEQAKKFIDMRFQKITCPKCGQVLGKYMFYVIDKGEKGSIESATKPVDPYKYTVRHECWKCGEMAETSNEGIVIVEK